MCVISVSNPADRAMIDGRTDARGSHGESLSMSSCGRLAKTFLSCLACQKKKEEEDGYTMSG